MMLNLRDLFFLDAANQICRVQIVFVFACYENVSLTLFFAMAQNIPEELAPVHFVPLTILDLSNT